MTGEYRAPQMSCRRGWPDPGCCRYDPGAIAGRKMNGRLADPGADRFGCGAAPGGPLRSQRGHLQPLQLRAAGAAGRSEEHTSELQSLMRISYAVFCLKQKTKHHTQDK